MSDIEFVDGLVAKAPHDNAPDFVKCAISIKRADLGNWLRQRTDEWINVDVKVAKSGKWYASVNDFKPERQQETPAPADNATTDDFDDGVPF